MPAAILQPEIPFDNWIADLIKPSGAKGVITINYGSNTTNNGPATTSEAANWVQYANIANNDGILYWEIGNEIYGNGYYSGFNWEYDLHVLNQNGSARVGNSALSPSAYGTNAAAFIKAMKAVDPNIKCGVYLSTSPYVPGWNQGVLTALTNALQSSGYTLDFVIDHWYPNGTNAQVLAAPATLNTEVSTLRSAIQQYYTLGNGSQLQILVTETAANTNGGLFPYLFTADEYLSWFEQGATNVEYQELNSGVFENSSTNTPIGPPGVGDAEHRHRLQFHKRGGQQLHHYGARIHFDRGGHPADLNQYGQPDRQRRLRNHELPDRPNDRRLRVQQDRWNVPGHVAG